MTSGQVLTGMSGQQRGTQHCTCGRDQPRRSHRLSAIKHSSRAHVGLQVRVQRMIARLDRKGSADRNNCSETSPRASELSIFHLLFYWVNTGSLNPLVPQNIVPTLPLVCATSVTRE